MLAKDLMSGQVVTASSDTPIGEAKALLKQHKIRRLVVVDHGRLVGLVTEDRLDRVSHPATAPALWQVMWLMSRTTLKDVMVTDVVTVGPEATAEQVVARAQSRGVGSVIVVEYGKVMGIVTTNDIFYKVVNPTLGIGEPGTRLVVPRCERGKDVEQVIGCINRAGLAIKVVWFVTSPATNEKELTVQLDEEDPAQIAKVMDELRSLGYAPSIRQR